uniref:Uncharacterized protein n=1 Tax=Arundo donax TaxID=35708 RepID=A0A0A9H8E4_ARUDO
MNTWGSEPPKPIFSSKCSSNSTSVGSNLTPAGSPGHSMETSLLSMSYLQFGHSLRASAPSSLIC